MHGGASAAPRVASGGRRAAPRTSLQSSARSRAAANRRAWRAAPGCRPGTAGKAAPAGQAAGCAHPRCRRLRARRARLRRRRQRRLRRRRRLRCDVLRLRRARAARAPCRAAQAGAVGRCQRAAGARRVQARGAAAQRGARVRRLRGRASGGRSCLRVTPKRGEWGGRGVVPPARACSGASARYHAALRGRSPMKRRRVRRSAGPRAGHSPSCWAIRRAGGERRVAGVGCVHPAQRPVLPPGGQEHAPEAGALSSLCACTLSAAWLPPRSLLACVPCPPGTGLPRLVAAAPPSAGPCALPQSAGPRPPPLQPHFPARRGSAAALQATRLPSSRSYSGYQARPGTPARALRQYTLLRGEAL